jgi:hypothetical protein
MLRFDAFDGKLYVKFDNVDGSWEIEGLGKKTYEDSISSNEPLAKVSEKLQAMLSKLPRNEITQMEESFLLNFDKSALYILEREFKEIIK